MNPTEQAELDRQFAEVNAAMKPAPVQLPLWSVPAGSLLIAVVFTLAWIVTP